MVLPDVELKIICIKKNETTHTHTHTLTMSHHYTINKNVNINSTNIKTNIGTYKRNVRQCTGTHQVQVLSSHNACIITDINGFQIQLKKHFVFKILQ